MAQPFGNANFPQFQYGDSAKPGKEFEPVLDTAQDDPHSVNYEMTPTAYNFHNSQEQFRYIFGPVGAGKTVMCCMELFFRMCAQAPDAFGVRKSRWLAIRSSYPQLRTTVIKTFIEWVGRATGHMNVRMSGSPLEWKARFPLSDGTIVEAEVWFKSLDKPQDVADLRSMEITGAYISECAEIPKAVIDMLKTRLNRYPKDVAPTWTGIFGESNPPSMRSHWHDTLEKERPANHRVFRQPPPLFYDPSNPAQPWVPNPMAENIRENMGGYNYYLNIMPGMDWDAINVLILGNYGTVKSGRPVYPEYQSHFHQTTAPIEPMRGKLVVVGMDFGLHTAAVPTQLTDNGSALVFPEIVEQNMMLEDFLKYKLIPVLRNKFAGCPILVVGDPSADRRETLARYNAIQTIQRAGLSVQPAISNDPTLRQQSVKEFLGRRDGLFLDMNATMLHEGFTAGYQFEERVQGGETTTIYKAKKNEFSHPHDALQYALLYWSKGSVLQRAAAPMNPHASTPVKDYYYV